MPITPGSAVSSFSSRPFAPSSAPPPAATNYAAVLRATASATPGASASTAATPSPLQAPPSRHTVAAETDSSDGPSPDENCSAAHAAILSQLDPAARELCSLLWPPWTDHVLMLAQKGLNKPSAAARGGHTRAEVNQAFLAAINACVAAKAPLAGLLDRASAHARKQLMLVSSAGAHALASTSPGLVSLKPQVRSRHSAWQATLATSVKLRVLRRALGQQACMCRCAKRSTRCWSSTAACCTRSISTLASSAICSGARRRQRRQRSARSAAAPTFLPQTTSPPTSRIGL